MATMQIKNLPEDVLRVFKVRAAKNGQSLQEYMRGYLVEEAAKPTLAELFAQIDERSPSGAGADDLGANDIVEAIHQGRETRDQNLADLLSRGRTPGDPE